MSLEVFEKLEAKVQQAIDTITLLQMEIEELKEKNNSLSQEVQSAQQQREEGRGFLSINALQFRRGLTMSLEVFEKLEAKVQQAIDTITLLQMEIEELKEKNNSLSQEVQTAQQQREELERENNSLKEQQSGWQDRLHALLGRMEEV